MSKSGENLVKVELENDGYEVHLHGFPDIIARKNKDEKGEYDWKIVEVKEGNDKLRQQQLMSAEFLQYVQSKLPNVHYQIRNINSQVPAGVIADTNNEIKYAKKEFSKIWIPRRTNTDKYKLYKLCTGYETWTTKKEILTIVKNIGIKTNTNTNSRWIDGWIQLNLLDKQNKGELTQVKVNKRGKIWLEYLEKNMITPELLKEMFDL